MIITLAGASCSHTNKKTPPEAKRDRLLFRPIAIRPVFDNEKAACPLLRLWPAFSRASWAFLTFWAAAFGTPAFGSLALGAATGSRTGGSGGLWRAALALVPGDKRTRFAAAALVLAALRRLPLRLAVLRSLAMLAAARSLAMSLGVSSSPAGDATLAGAVGVGRPVIRDRRRFVRWNLPAGLLVGALA